MEGRWRGRRSRVGVCGWVGVCSHAVAEAGLLWLAVARRCWVAVAVGLLGGHGHVGPRCEHELWRACNTDGRGRIVRRVMFLQPVNVVHDHWIGG